MPRDASGNYTLPLADVVAGATIEASWANVTLADLAQAMTESLSREGDGGLTAPLALTDGTAVLPSLTFINETNTGLYRAGTGDVHVVIGGVSIMRYYTGGATPLAALTGDLTVSETFTSSKAATFQAVVNLYDSVNDKTATLANVDRTGTSTVELDNPDGPVSVISGGETFGFGPDGNLSIPATAIGGPEDVIRASVGDARYGRIHAEGVVRIEDIGTLASLVWGNGLSVNIGQTDVNGNPYYTLTLDNALPTQYIIHMTATIGGTGFGAGNAGFSKAFVTGWSGSGTSIEFKIYKTLNDSEFGVVKPVDLPTNSHVDVHITILDRD